jgi:hypothetical protein
VKIRGWRIAVYLATAALLLSVAAGLVVYYVPLATSESASVTVTPTSTSTSAPVISNERLFTGASLTRLWPLILPVLLCALATWSAARHHRWPLITVMSLLAVFAFLTGFSIGLFYVPAVGLLVVSVIVVGAVDGSSRGESSVAGKW